MPIILPKCKTGYELNRDNCRCYKKENKTKKVKKTKLQRLTIKKTKKKTPPKKNKQNAKKKCTTEKQEECFKKTKICNPKTGRCINPPKKTVRKKTTLKKTKKQINKIITETLEDVRSYSPTINKEIERLSITPHIDLMAECADDEIYVPYPDSQKDPETGMHIGRCMKWNSKKGQKYLLDNLKSKKPVNPNHIMGPFQTHNNCWFNVFFMLFFISDKGRKFFKAFRESMITGVFKTTGEKIPKAIRYPFWLLNKQITAVLVGHNDPQRTVIHMDTNSTVNAIYKQLKKYDKTLYLGYNRANKPGEAGNPITMLMAITNYFDRQYNARGFGLSTSHLWGSYKEFTDIGKKNSPTYKRILKNKYHIIIIEIGDDDKWNGKKTDGKYAKVKDFKKNLTYKIGDMEYKLDSIGIRDNKKGHICALITLNGEDYVFDGENSVTVKKRKWRNLLNRNKNFIITEQAGERYNLTQGYQCLIYYRSK